MTSVDLPWSKWAMMQKLQMSSVISGGKYNRLFSNKNSVPIVRCRII
jgi:hypothetical protein